MQTLNFLKNAIYFANEVTTEVFQFSAYNINGFVQLQTQILTYLASFIIMLAMA